MTHWNKVSLASLYLSHVRSDVDKGLVRAWFFRSVSSPQVFAVCVFILGNSWLTFNAMILTCSFGLFDNKAQYFEHFVLLVKICKPVFLGGFLQPIFF